ncbi:hypothetical protein PC121_g23524 [Phytophthora cactorum]|nr:hypothetical protein PC121_g23524 [Phytophthora cactorum]
MNGWNQAASRTNKAHHALAKTATAEPKTRNSSHAVAIAAHHGTERALGLASWITSRIRLNVVTARSGRYLCG